MAKVRSPNFPGMDLGKALTFARKVFDKDNRNKVSRETVAKHLGHESLSGPALTKIGALRAYGLIDGSGDELRITEDAISAMLAPEASSERKDALGRLAQRPALFQEIRKDFPTTVSEDNLRFWLIKRQFTTEAAGKASKTYLATMRLVHTGMAEYDSGSEEDETEPPMPSPSTEATPQAGQPRGTSASVSHHQQMPPFPAGVEMNPSAKDQYNVATYSSPDGSRIRVTADLNIGAAKRLVKILENRIRMIEEEEGILGEDTA